MIASDIMSRDAAVVRPDATARDVVELLSQTHHSALPVVDEDNRVVGVVSYRDLMRLALPDYLDGVDLSFLPASAGFFPACASPDCLGDATVETFMRRDYLPRVPPTEPVAEVARIMLNNNVRRVVVVDEGSRLLGVVSRGDIVRAIVQPAIIGDEDADS